ncbi:hypothetical protein AA103587_0959 [Gluconobacter kanchanaburiensis NBRC 103587]|nr:hypothetical protein AA103587_0959 [Gluconobacter kanchanaburiensis NBRC 103587]
MVGQGRHLIRRAPKSSGNLEGCRHSGSVEQLEVWIEKNTDLFGHGLK